MEKKRLENAAEWLIDSYRFLHEEISPWDTQEIYASCADGDAALIRMLHLTMGKDLTEVFADASEKIMDICEISQLGYVHEPAEGEVETDIQLINDAAQAAKDVTELARQYAPDAYETCRQNGVYSDRYARKAAKKFNKVLAQIKKDQESSS